MIETMSLDDMREYLGQDQIPEDFDDFWKKQTMKYQGNIEYRLDKKISILLLHKLMIFILKAAMTLLSMPNVYSLKQINPIL